MIIIVLSIALSGSYILKVYILLTDSLDQYEERANQLQGEVEKIHDTLKEEKERTQTLTSEKMMLEEDLKSTKERSVPLLHQLMLTIIIFAG